ncbi:M48 family metallopeptidase [Phenylobacterium sp.]|jgi:predicted Zn-dependent protease|uniref:M48 family metallopeptidase n=1 Tax=Phenylobacterium sp. TaxID=1871053 RepID=UPI002E31069C|nr:M48 family metallopeptidase [Phenylobacterium sp.]HEX3363747.1 M48 family metallopeptidase [Phenylobacterium sp.]
MSNSETIGRRGLLTGAAAGAALAATPAMAQIPSFGSLPGVSGLPSGVGRAADLIGQAANVIANMQISEADEISMGTNYYERFIDQSGGRYNSIKDQGALRRFAEPLIATSKRAGLPWDIALIDADTVNAWALPGGKIAVHKGLIRYCASPEELGAVISHEIGHAELSHGVAQIKNKKFVQGMGGIAKQQIVEQVGRKTGGAGAFLTSEVLTAFEGPVYDMVTSGYSQDLEYAADGHIVRVFHTVGYDSTHAPDFFNTMLRLVPPGTKATTSLYSTHPGTKDRIKRLQKVIQTDKTPMGSSDSSHPGWAELKQSFPTRTVFRLT